MKTCRLRIVFVNYFKNLCNLRNLWIKKLVCGYAALWSSGFLTVIIIV